MKLMCFLLLCFSFVFSREVEGDEISLVPEIVPTGKQPAGIALIGNLLWVAESGEDTLGKYSLPAGNLIERVESGKLPVHLAANGGTLYASANTDFTIWQQPATGPGKVVAHSDGDLPAGIAADEKAAYVLLHPGGTGADSVVMRIDSATSAATRSLSLGQNAADLVVTGDSLWVLNSFLLNESPNATLSRLDPASMKVLERFDIGGQGSELSESDGLLFVGGSRSEKGTLASYETESGEMYSLGEYTGSGVAALGIEGDFVVSADLSGTLYIHDKDALVQQRTIRLEVGAFTPGELLVTPDTIYLSATQGDAGLIYMVNNWKPKVISTESAEDLFLTNESIGGVGLELSEEELIKRHGQPEKWGEEFEDDVVGDFLIEAAYPSKGLFVMLASLEKGEPRSVESVRIEGNSTLATAGGIRIGATLGEVRRVYGQFEDKIEFPVPDPPGEEFTFVAGTIYEGLIFRFKGGRVISILLGSGEE